MYLSKLTLDPRSRQVQKELRNPYQLHRTVMRGFPETLPSGERVLYRLDVHPRTGAITLLIQSRTTPDWSPLEHDKRYLLEPAAVKSYDSHIAVGQKLRFRLRANPTVKTRSKQHPEKKTRVPLLREEEQLAWLQRKGDQHGFRILQAQAAKLGDQMDWINREEESHRLQVYMVQFDGVLQVTDAEAFGRALAAGIGPAKAFGCGLLSVARAG